MQGTAEGKPERFPQCGRGARQRVQRSPRAATTGLKERRSLAKEGTLNVSDTIEPVHRNHIRRA